MIKKLQSFFPVTAGALIFMIFALYNRYPIVTGDTTSYLESAFALKVASERPVFYGLFIRATSLGLTVWGPIVVQCLLLSYLCLRFFKSILPGLPDLHTLALLLFTSLGTIAGWYAGQLVPDTFTPILFLALYLYLRAENTGWERIFLLVVIYLATVVHYSHYVIATVFITALLLLGWLYKTGFAAMRKKLLQLLALTVLCWLSLFTSNFIGGKGFTSSHASPVFLMGKLCESGLLKTYLDEACPVKNYKICAYKDSLPPVAWEFVWDAAHSPVFKTGGWEANLEEYRAIMGDIVSKPKYWPAIACKSIGATLRQVVLTNIDESEELHWTKYEKDHPLYQALQQYFPHEINSFATSRQNWKTLNITFYDEVFVIVLLLSSFCCMLLLRGDIKKKAGSVYFLLVLYLLVNAFATATFGNVLTRLNSRDIWLLPMVNIVFIYASRAGRNETLPAGGQLSREKQDVL